jgi:glycogen operon protein
VYCQDNELSWFDWEGCDEQLSAFAHRLTAMRRDHPVFRRRGWFQGRPIHGAEVGDVAWFQPDGNEMTDDDWNVSFAKSLGLFLNGSELPHVGSRGEPIHDASFFLLFNAHHEPIDFVLPEERWGKQWSPVVDTAAPEPDAEVAPVAAGERVRVAGRSVVVLVRQDPAPPARRSSSAPAPS